MEKRRTLVISDIHGCYNEFIKLLKEARYQGKRDRLILLGDYVDRGVDSFNVIKKIQRLQKSYGKKNVIALLGNHEDMMIDALYRREFFTWDYNGGGKTYDSYLRGGKDVYSDLKWLERLPLYYEDEHFFYVHAGFKPYVSIEMQKKNDMVWIREEFMNSSYDFGKNVIFGHTPTIIESYYKPLRYGMNVCIDTGCAYGGRLSCIEIIENDITNIFQVDSETIVSKMKKRA